MLSEIFVKRYNDFSYKENEILRYAGCVGVTDDSDMVKLMRECISEVQKANILTYNICFRIVPVNEITPDGNIDFSILKTKSNDLAKCINGCDNAVFMAATVGHGIDRLIHKYSRLNPAKALFLQAIGAERVETMLDCFCSEFGNIYKEYVKEEIIKITPRFSPGYGDLPLQIQPDFLDTLDTSRKIGITINDSLLMNPSKSVTAIAGIQAYD